MVVFPALSNPNIRILTSLFLLQVAKEVRELNIDDNVTPINEVFVSLGSRFELRGEVFVIGRIWFRRVSNQARMRNF